MGNVRFWKITTCVIIEKHKRKQGKKMKILAFDTSSTALSVALLEDENLVAEATVTVKKNHSISLMPTIDFLVAQASWQPADLDRIVVAQGPGSYTGLRVAVATAKTLAYALDIDLVGVSSLQALTNLSVDGVVIPIMDARRNNVYVGFYENGQAIVPDCHAAFTDVLEQAKTFEKVTFVGEVVNFVDQIKESLPEATILSSLPSALLIGRLGLSLPPVNVDAFVPHYLKRVEAEENWLKTHEETNRDTWTIEQVVADLALDTTEYFYVYDQEEVVGFLALQNLVGELEVTNIAVLKAYQGRGYASQLMKYLEERSEPIFLEVRDSNQVAQALYRKFGFDSLGIRKNYYHEPQEDAVIMRREEV